MMKGAKRAVVDIICEDFPTVVKYLEEDTKEGDGKSDQPANSKQSPKSKDILPKPQTLKKKEEAIKKVENNKRRKEGKGVGYLHL
jgi:hypothetical protein